MSLVSSTLVSNNLTESVRSPTVLPLPASSSCVTLLCAGANSFANSGESCVALIIVLYDFMKLKRLIN